MNHPDWPAFLAAILSHPDDDTARLAAADFLEENGDAERAAFIRVQIAIARLEAGGLGKSLEMDQLRAKERAFLGPLSMFRPFWASTDCPELLRWKDRGGGRAPLEAMSVEGADRLIWRRGFVEAVTCSVAEWHQHGTSIRKRNPIRAVGLVLEGAEFDRGVCWGMLGSLRGLSLVAIVESGHVPRDLLDWLRSQLPEAKVCAVDETSGGIEWPPRNPPPGGGR
jgi:uncharacterized protein (TIGR02996 family)